MKKPKQTIVSAKSGPAWPGNTLENQLRASLWLIEEQRKGAPTDEAARKSDCNDD